MEEITLKSIYSDIIDLVRETSKELGISREEVLTDLYLDYLKQEGIATSPEIVNCYNTEVKEFSQNYYKINAFDYSEESGSLDLFITHFIDKDELPELKNNKIDACHNAVYRFFIRCIESDSLVKAYREIDPDMAEIIEMIKDEYKKKNIQQIRFIIMSNGVVKSDFSPYENVTIGDQNIPVEHIIWDMEATLQSERATQNNPNINVDLESMFQPLECIQCEETAEIKSYLAVMPAMVLAQIYNKYHVRLLNQNVRNYLGGRNRKNQSMIETIRKNGGRFFAYNNGISSVAYKVNTKLNDDGRLVITGMDNWQIVNGGQTTNVIYYIYTQKKERELLNGVNVAMKVSEIKIQEDMEKKKAVSNIARYANSQNQVKDSDFAVNEPYMHLLKEMSIKETSPIGTPRAGTKWFFVRMRGEYEDAKISMSIKKWREFVKSNPKNQVLEKTDVAKLEMAWLLLPHISCMGGEKCFDRFWKTVMDNDELVVDEKYFHRLVAKEIIAQKTIELFHANGGKGYSNVIQYYALAIIAMRSHGKFDLDYVWEHQDVQPTLIPIITESITIISNYIKLLGADVDRINITSAVKKTDFWKAITLRINKIPEFDSSLLIQSNGDELTKSQKDKLSEFEVVSSEEWESLAVWGKASRKLSLLERKKIEHIAVSVSKNKSISFDYAIEVMEIYKKAKAMGWN